MHIYITNTLVLMFDNIYKELEASSKGNYLEKGSKFISYAIKVKTNTQVKEKLDKIKKIEKSANHYCYAYVLHPDKSATYFNDDGEPRSTAGKPILGQIQSHDLTNILIIVVRYFGGTKLGVSGLIRSYKNAAKDAIKNSKIIINEIKEVYSLEFNFEKINTIMKIIKANNIDIINKKFDSICFMEIKITKNKSDEMLNKFKENLIGLKIKYIKTI